MRPTWLRWSFNTKLWKPTAEEWIRSCNCVQREEVDRINRFVFKAPAISALVGRLMLRKGISVVTGRKNADVKLTRTEEGRPVLEDRDIRFDYNISHHGHWVVLVLESQSRVGIDIMSLDRPINTDMEEYFHLMKRQFTEEEWKQIRSADNSLHAFYRFWCLKESFVKAVGVGLNINLQTISFITKDPLKMSELTTSTKLAKSGSDRSVDWAFEETLLDTDHCVAVCREPSTSCENDNVSVDGVVSYDRLFTVVTIETLLDLSPLSNYANHVTWDNFNNKQYSAR